MTDLNEEWTLIGSGSVPDDDRSGNATPSEPAVPGVPHDHIFENVALTDSSSEDELSQAENDEHDSDLEPEDEEDEDEPDTPNIMHEIYGSLIESESVTHGEHLAEIFTNLNPVTAQHPGISHLLIDLLKVETINEFPEDHQSLKCEELLDETDATEPDDEEINRTVSPEEDQLKSSHDDDEILEYVVDDVPLHEGSSGQNFAPHLRIEPDSTPAQALQMQPGVSFKLRVCKGLAFALSMWITILAFHVVEKGSGFAKAIAIHEVLNASASEFHMDNTLVQAWKRDLKNCERSCCFRQFILAGHSPSHKLAIQGLLHSLPHAYLEQIDASRLAAALHGVDNFEELLGNFFWPRTEKAMQVLLVENAQKLQALQLEMLNKLGANRCKPKRGQNKRFHTLILVLSTNAGEEFLSTPEDVMSSNYIEQARIAVRDWLALPEIALNQHQIFHGVKGTKIREVFEEYFRTRASFAFHLGQLASHEIVSNWILKPVSFGVQTPSAASHPSNIQQWFDDRKDTIVVTEAARKLVLTEIAKRSIDSEKWLREHYSSWTRGESCRAVLYRISARELGSFQVFCN